MSKTTNIALNHQVCLYVCVCVRQSYTIKSKKTHKNRTTEHNNNNNSNTREHRKSHAFGSSEINDATPYMFVVYDQQQKQWQK